MQLPYIGTEWHLKKRKYPLYYHSAESTRVFCSEYMKYGTAKNDHFDDYGTYLRECLIELFKGEDV